MNRRELEQRAARFAADVLRVCAYLRRKRGGAKPADQLQRSSSSVAANYRAAGRARSSREFLAKMGVVNEEADETVFWFEYIRAAGFVTAVQSGRLYDEAQQLRAIFAAAYRTARSRRPPQTAREVTRTTSPHRHIATSPHEGRRYTAPMSLSITWLGHSSFSILTPGGKAVLFDPWYTGNPSFPEGKKPAAADLILLSHGHSDHITDAAAMAKATGATVVGIWEITSWLGTKGVQQVEPMNKGGTITAKGLRITMTDARHSSSIDDGGGIVYLGEPAGFVVGLENGQRIYYAGDTALFGDMKLIGEIYKPDIAFLPIGDRFTMGPDTAATAARWLGVKQVVPMHWGTFPLLTGTPEQLKQQLEGSGIQVLELRPGETAA